MPVIDIVGEAIPNWIVAVTSVFTLGAAIFAGVFARRAAHYTRVQAVASHEQVRLGEESLRIAQDEMRTAQEAAEAQRQDADRAYRNFAETRLDPLTPVILATAEPYDHYSNGFPDSKLWLECRRSVNGSGSWTPWEAVTETFEEPPGPPGGLEFRTQLVVSFTNVSDQIARISLVNPGNGEIEEHRQGADIYIQPQEKKKVLWVKRWGLGMLATDEDVNNPANWLFNLEFWVRDLGMNVRDTYKFNGDLRLFERDGSRLVVRNEPPFPWDQDIATPMPGRTYERLDAWEA